MHLAETMSPRGIRPLVRRALFGAGCVLLLVAAAAYSYLRMFSQRAPYDDEGYIIQSIQSYLAGQRLYDDVFSQYGPAFYLLQRVVHGWLAVPLTHDAVRLGTIVLWLATTAVAACLVLRLTGSTPLAAISFAQTLIHLVPVVNEPGHPQVLLALVTCTVCLLVADCGGRLSPRVAVSCGLLCAFAVLVKVNVGVYLFLGLAIPLLLATPFRPVGLVASFAAPTLPFILLKDHLGDRATNLAFVAALSVASVLVASYRQLAPSLLTSRHLWLFASSLAAGVSTISIALLVDGTSLSGFIDGVLIQPGRLATTFFVPLRISTAAMVASFLSLLLAFVSSRRFASGTQSGSALLVAAKGAFGLAALFVSVDSHVAQVEWLTPFLWILVPPVGAAAHKDAVLGRSILAHIGAWLILQAYPVAGTQVAVATVLLFPAAMICLHDVIVVLGARWHFSPVRVAAARAAVIVCAVVVFYPALGPALWRQLYRVYAAGQELRLPGATLLRLPAGEVARQHWLAGTLRANCSLLLTLPALNSLHLWSGLPPPTSKNPTTWMTLLSARDQDRLWSAVDASASPCAVFHREIAGNWLDGRPPEALPAYRSLMARFTPIQELDGYSLMVRRDRALSPVMHLLIAGRQSFSRERAPLLVASTFVNHQPGVTLRAWIRSTRRGTIFGCQTYDESGAVVVGGVPLIYIGSSGRVYGQFPTTSGAVQSSTETINDGGWHHVVLVRDRHSQAFYVDGRHAASLSEAMSDLRGSSCQVGLGFTTGWPDASAGWMSFTGDVEGLAVVKSSWTPEEVARDLEATPRQR